MAPIAKSHPARGPIRLLAVLCALALAGALGPRPASAQAEGGSLRERIQALRAARQARSDAPALNPQAAPGAIPNHAGDYSLTLRHAGEERAYLVHVPASYDPSRPMPLLVSLHGGGANMQYQADDSHYGQISKSERSGFVVAFPNGHSRLPGGKLATWNGGGCCGPARDQNVDDVGFIRAMVAQIEASLSIDKGRVFATGMSNGGIMAQRLACDMADVFKAIAPVAGTDNTISCSPSRPVSVLMLHAKDDDHLPFGGGMGPKSMGSAVTEFTSVPESFARWARRDGCSGAPVTALQSPGVLCQAYPACQGGSAVELCATDTGGHSWPGAPSGRGGAEPSRAIDANDAMWDFFMSRP